MRKQIGFSHIGFPPRPNTCAFALVELLVVIAIIMLLVSILLPALQKAKMQGEQAKCSVHLR